MNLLMCAIVTLRLQHPGGHNNNNLDMHTTIMNAYNDFSTILHVVSKALSRALFRSKYFNK